MNAFVFKIITGSNNNIKTQRIKSESVINKPGPHPSEKRHEKKRGKGCGELDEDKDACRRGHGV